MIYSNRTVTISKVVYKDFTVALSLSISFTHGLILEHTSLHILYRIVRYSTSIVNVCMYGL